MSFLSKLFKCGKSKKEDRRIDSEVEKVIKSPDEETTKEVPTEEPTEEPTKVEIPVNERVTPEQALAAWVLDLYEKGKFAKDYQLVHNFLVYTNAREVGLRGLIGGMYGIDFSEYTEEMISFIKMYRVRKLKCTDKEFQNWITNVII